MSFSMRESVLIGVTLEAHHVAHDLLVGLSVVAYDGFRATEITSSARCIEARPIPPEVEQRAVDVETGRASMFW